MALDKMVDSTQLDSDLTSVANAIRAKSGGSGQLAFPSGFVSEIGNIPSGGGGDYVASDWLDMSKPTGEISSDASSLANNIMNGRTGITKVFLSNADAPNSSFYGCTGLQYAVLVKGGVSAANAFSGCSNLLAADMGRNISGVYAFYKCAKLKTIVLRKSTVASLSNTSNVFTNSPFDSGKSGGTLYVPNDLISSYQSASNWSTILGYPNNQIKSIESTHTDPDAPIDLTLYYIDGTPIPTT